MAFIASHHMATNKEKSIALGAACTAVGAILFPPSAVLGAFLIAREALSDHPYEQDDKKFKSYHRPLEYKMPDLSNPRF